MKKMRLIELVVFIIVCIVGVIGIGYVIYNVLENYEKRIQAYEYLSKYVAYIAECKTTMYTTSPKECGKKKRHIFYGVTYSGTKAVKYRTVAVDPDVIRLGSVLIDVQTEKVYIAEDTGSGVKGWHVDVFIGEGTKENIKKALDYGVKYKQFLVIEPGNLK